jgi:hypothetical protein
VAAKGSKSTSGDRRRKGSGGKSNSKSSGSSSRGNGRRSGGSSSQRSAQRPQYPDYSVIDPHEIPEGPDVLLDVPVVKVDEIDIEVADLRAQVAVMAEVRDLVELNIGADVGLGKVELKIEGVEAQALLKARLDNVSRILERVLMSLDRNPELLEGIGHAVEEVGRGGQHLLSETGEAVEDVGEGAEGAVQDVGQGAGQAVGQVGQGASHAVGQVGQGAGQAVGDVGQGANQALAGVGQGARQGVEGVGKGARQEAENLTQGGQSRGGGGKGKKGGN